MKRIFAVTLAVLLLIFSLTACSEMPVNTENNTSSTVKEKENIETSGSVLSSENVEQSENIIDLSKVSYKPQVMLDMDIATDIATLSERSDFIVIGKVSDEGLGMFMGESRNFLFEIEEVPKGEINEARIEITNAYFNMENIDENYGNVLLKDPFYSEPKAGDTYMLFLSKTKIGEHEMYTSSVIPSMIKITDGKAVLELPEILQEGYDVQKAVTDTNKVVEYTFMSGIYEDNISGMTLDELKEAIK